MGTTSVVEHGEATQDEAAVLLTTQTIEGVVYPLSLGAYKVTRLQQSSSASQSLLVKRVNPPPSWGSCLVLHLPDHPPLRDPPPATLIHIFALPVGEETDRLLQSLRIECLELEKEIQGISVSNVGGFHSEEEEMFDLPSSGVAIVSPPQSNFKSLHPYLSEALNCVLSPPAEVSAIQEGASQYPAVDAKDDASCMLLRGQRTPFQHDYNYVPIKPSRGRLVIFPGYVPHCVLPPATSSSSKTRIAIACNLDDSTVVGWCGVNRNDNYNALHDHGSSKLSCVFYVDDGI
jgi:hypothetical protein